MPSLYVKRISYPVCVSPLTRRTAYAAEQRRRGEAALLAAAEELVAAGTPFSDLSVDTISKHAGFSRATFYAYFTDKRALAIALGERLGAALQDATSEFLEGDSADLRQTLEGALAIFSAHAGTVRTLVEASAYDAEVATFWRALHERFGAQARDRITAARPDLDAATVAARAFVLIWTVERCLTEHLAAPQVEEAALFDALELVWRAAST